MYRFIVIIFFVVLITCSAAITRKKRDPETLRLEKIELGRQLFFDKALSNPDGQSCTVCHAPKTAFSDPNHAAVSEGMIDGAFVGRNSPSLTYVSFIPPLSYDEINGLWKGGLFWDGRSNSLEHQLSGPFFNPAEMNNEDTTMLISAFREAPYFYMYKSIYGKTKDEEIIFRNMTEAIAMFERSEILNEFSSKFDLSLIGKATLSDKEKRGLELFNGKANCTKCHSMTPDPTTGKILFSDFSYHNIGVPRNEENPFYTTSKAINPKGRNAMDIGLGGVLNDSDQDGKFRVPTLRNVQYTGPYFHNGFFKTLPEVVHFMNTRNHGNYPEAEVKTNIARQLTGSQNLNDDEEGDVVAFLLTLTDGYSEE